MAFRLMLCFYMTLFGFAEILAVVIAPYEDAKMGIPIKMSGAYMGMFFLGFITAFMGAVFTGAILQQQITREKEQAIRFSQPHSS